jgi:hypothetical protein
MSLTTTNEKIVTFYQKHPSLSFDHANLLLIDLMEKMIEDSLSTSMVSQLVEKLKTIEGDIKCVNECVNRNQQENYTQLSLKMRELKSEYIEDVKTILTSNVSEKISPLLKDYNQTFLDKTQLLFNDIIPKNNSNLQEYIKSILEHNPQSVHEDLINLEQKFTATQLALTTTNERMEYGFKELKTNQDHQFGNVREIATSNQQSVAELLGKMNNSSSKGKLSENMLFSILQTLYPSAIVDSVGTTKESGDVMLERRDKPRILIENKDYNRSVPTEEVNKFIRDIETQKGCCGLFLSQSSGICGKESFEIQVHDSCVLLYIHNVNNDADKIKIGIDIIDHFKEMLDNLDQGAEVDTINKDVLKEMNDEYKVWVTTKTNMLKGIKEFHESMKKQLDTMTIPTLEKYLSTRFTPITNGIIYCQYCDFPCKNKQSHSAHLRGCAKKKETEKS